MNFWKRQEKKTLIKIGEIIGDQTEIYEEKPRQFPIHLNYPHVMNRHIVVEIPDGYSITNLKDLNIQSICKDNDQRTMGFESTYRLEKNTLIIDVVEDYRLISYPVTQYPAFQKVINSAADFNKVILVLEKI